MESVAESEVMRILILVRNFVEGYKQASPRHMLSASSSVECIAIILKAIRRCMGFNWTLQEPDDPAAASHHLKGLSPTWCGARGMHVQAVNGEWDIPRLTKDAYDLKGKTVGTLAAGRIGCHVIKRLKVCLIPHS